MDSHGTEPRPQWEEGANTFSIIQFRVKFLFNQSLLGEWVFLHRTKVFTKWGYAKLHQETTHLPMTFTARNNNIKKNI
jgi:hypothetical protein